MANIHRARATTTWTAGKYTKTERIRQGTFSINAHTERTVEKLEGEFEITVDIDRLVAKLAAQCSGNRTGQARFLGGIVKAKRVATKVLDSRVEQIPLPKGYTVDPLENAL